MNKLTPYLLVFVPLFIMLALCLDASAQQNTNTHTVERGETLYSIARQYDIPLSELRSWNNLSGSEIEVGQQLYVSKPGSTTISYSVKPGDTLFGISKQFSVTIAELKEWNNLQTNSLEVGQRLTIHQAQAEVGTGTGAGKTGSGQPSLPATQPDTTQSIIGANTGTGGSTKNYIVKSGDTLYDIARAHNMSVAQLKALNNLTSNTLRVGQRLAVTSLQSAPSVGGNTSEEVSLGKFRVYRVQSGDTFSAILKKFKMDENEFTALNPQVAPNEIARGLNITVLEPPSRVFKNPYRTKATLHDLGTTAVSLYSDSQIGKPVTAGGLYNPQSLSAAHANISLGKVIYIENPENGRGVFVAINDRVTDGAIKLSKQAYESLAFSEQEQARVKIYQDENE